MCFGEEILDESHKDAEGFICCGSKTEAIQVAGKNSTSAKGSYVLANASRRTVGERTTATTHSHGHLRPEFTTGA